MAKKSMNGVVTQPRVVKAFMRPEEQRLERLSEKINTGRGAARGRV